MSSPVTVISGANRNELFVAGLTIGEVRDNYGDALGIAPAAVALVNGERADSDRTLEGGDELTFQKEVARKG